MVFFAGLPGTGKSLLVHQLTHLALAQGRIVHLLQWDVARPVCEASPAGRRYPMADGVTHALIRKAAGLWAREAVAAWHEAHPDPRHLLVGETPFVGNRFVELAQRADDGAEPLLCAEGCRFVLAVPSVEVRQFLEAERGRRAAAPLHPREREDAPPHVLRALWEEIARVAQLPELSRGSATSAPGRAPARPGDVRSTSYDPAAYRRVYEEVLAHRNVDTVALDTILPTGRLSVYDFAAAPPDLVPTAAEAEGAIREIERRSPEPARLDREVARWWAV